MQKISASACPAAFSTVSIPTWCTQVNKHKGSSERIWGLKVKSWKSSKGGELRMFRKVLDSAFQTHSVVKLKMPLYTSLTAAFKLSGSKLESRHTALWWETANGRNFGREIWNGVDEAGGAGNSFYWIYMARFWELGATGLASVRRHQKLSPCQMGLIPAGCRIDLPLAKAETISDTGSASGITYLRRGKIKLHSSWERGTH